MIKIAIADGHEIYRLGLSQLLAAENDIEIIYETNSFHKLYKKLTKKAIDVALITSNIAGYGLSTSTSLLNREFPNVKIAVLGDEYNNSAMLSLFQKGIYSYLLRTASKNEIIAAIKKISGEEYYFQRGTPPHVKKSILKQKYDLNQDFNDREIEIIQLICEDKSNQEIADNVCLSVRTIEWYRRAILAKMNVKSPVGIFKYALQNQIYQL